MSSHDPTNRSRRWLVIAVIAVVLVCVGLPVTVSRLLSDWMGPRDGDDIARDLIRVAAAQVEEGLGYSSRQRNAETIAAVIIQDEQLAGSQTGGSSLRIDPVAWSGRVTGSEQASVDVRFTATVRARNAMGFGDGGHTAGSATMCYRYLLQLYRYAERDEIDCPDIADPPTPVPEVIPALPDDARERLEAVLLAATPHSLADDLRAAFPDEFITIDSVTYGDELVAAVGVPAERDCLVGVRRGDGTIDYPAFDRVWLEPGELGCRVTLYTAPPA